MLVSLHWVQLRNLLRNIPHCFIALSYLTHIYPQKDCRKEYNHVRPHSALNYGPSLPEAIIPWLYEVVVDIEFSLMHDVYWRYRINWLWLAKNGCKGNVSTIVLIPGNLAKFLATFSFFSLSDGHLSENFLFWIIFSLNISSFDIASGDLEDIWWS